MTLHSSIVGGSTAGRLLACPASFQATVALPPSVDKSSIYAEEGTFAHAVMEAIMTERAQHLVFNCEAEAERLIGETIEGRLLTSGDFEDMIRPAVAALKELEHRLGGGFRVIAVEKQVRFPGIVGAFGTIDLILASPNVVLHIDWKFGQGIPVSAEGPAGINPQLLFYTTAARYSLKPKIYDYGRKRMVGAIIQPRSDEPISYCSITMDDIKRFRKDLERAVDIALKPIPYRTRGEHCRFAPCKLTCPLWTGPLLDLSVLLPVKPDSPLPQVTDYGRYLADAKALVDQLALFKKEIDDQMHSYLEAGGDIPGWRLKAKVKQRQWIDSGIVAEELRRLGFADAEIWQQKLVTFASADATAKRRNVKIPDGLREAPPNNETTIATVDDPAPVVERSLVVEHFRASLKALKGAAE